MLLLGVNVDPVSITRETRGGPRPDLVSAVVLAELGGADWISLHSSPAERPIDESLLVRIRSTLATRLNLVAAPDERAVAIVLCVRPDRVTLASGLPAGELPGQVGGIAWRLADAGIGVCVRVNPHPREIEWARDLPADAVELDTQGYSGAASIAAADAELGRLRNSAALARETGLHVAAGGGLSERDVPELVRISDIQELVIGRSIFSRAIMVGLVRAVAEMRYLIGREAANPGFDPRLDGCSGLLGG